MSAANYHLKALRINHYQLDASYSAENYSFRSVFGGHMDSRR